MASPPNLPKLDATTSHMPAGTSAVTPAGAAPGVSAGVSGIPFTPPPQTPTPTRAVVDTGAGPSGIREDMLSEGWTDYSSRSPPRTQVSDASGQLLQVKAEVSLTIYVGGTAMEYDFLVVKSLSVPLILGWDFQRNYVDTISPKTQKIKWDDDTFTVAVRSWTWNTRPAPPRRGNKPKNHIGAIRL